MKAEPEEHVIAKFTLKGNHEESIEVDLLESGCNEKNSTSYWNYVELSVEHSHNGDHISFSFI